MYTTGKNISYVVKYALCMGCGLCYDICSKQAISMSIIKGQNRPVVNSEKCNECGLCLKACAGQGIDIAAKSLLYDVDDIQYDRMIGYYMKCYEGWSLDYDIRYHGASGGMVSQMLIYLLEKEIIDGAVVTGFCNDNPLRPHTYIARTKEEILHGRSSKYCVVSYKGIAKEIEASSGKYVVVGLPCHIHAFRKYEVLHKKIREKIFGYFAIYCSATKSYNSIDYMMYRYDVDPKEVGYFTYRDDGCMGYMKIINKKGELMRKIKCLSYYIPLHGFFNTQRCSLCIDHYGELADICFGDIKTGENDSETIGESSFLVRNKKFIDIVEQAIVEGVIYAREISADFLNSTQGYAKKHKKGQGIIAAFSFRRFLHLPVPEYDVEIPFKINMRFLLRELQNYIVRFIGEHRMLWLIIRKLDKNKDQWI